jgi:sarcosine oxidase gamma subunit
MFQRPCPPAPESAPPSTIPELLRRYGRATLAELCEKYQELFQEETRSRHRGHLFRRIAWQLQALAEGDLPERARRRAQQIAQDADLRMVGPRDFLILKGARVTPRTRAAVAGTRTAASLCPALY